MGHISGKDDKPILGIALMVAATLLLALMDATGKHLTADYPVTEILAARYSVFLIFALLQAWPKGIRRSFTSGIMTLQIVRSLVLVAEVSVFLLAFKSLPLATVHSVSAATPLIATALAVPLLGEKVGLHRWLAVIIGCFGVLLIIRPGANIFGGAIYLPLIGAVLWALYQILVRRATADGPETTSLFTATIGLFVFALTLPFAWKTPGLQDSILFLAVGIFGGGAHILLIKSLQLAPTAVLQPLNYLLVLWGVILGYLVFDNLPDIFTVAGVLIITACGLYTLHRQRHGGYLAARSAVPRRD